jgi:hypothetical protein
VADRLAHLGQRRRVRHGLEERAHLVIALQSRADLLDLHLVDAVLRFRPALHVLAQQQLDVDLQNVGDLVDDGELVEPADPPLHLVDPALGLSQPVSEDLLGHLASAAPVGDAAADRQLVHGASPDSPGDPRRRALVSTAVWIPHVRARRTACVIACSPMLVVFIATCKGWICRPNDACRAWIRLRRLIWPPSTQIGGYRAMQWTANRPFVPTAACRPAGPGTPAPACPALRGARLGRDARGVPGRPPVRLRPARLPDHGLPPGAGVLGGLRDDRPRPGRRVVAAPAAQRAAGDRLEVRRAGGAGGARPARPRRTPAAQRACSAPGGRTPAARSR